MKVLVVDDERLARKELINLLKEYKELQIIGEAANADEAMEIIEKQNPDVLFLDIQMPGKTGFELLEMLDKAPTVIFTTAYDEFALKAFEVNAFDYLLKPIQTDRLKDAIQKLKTLEPNSSDNSSGNKDKILTLDDQVFVKDGDRCWFVRIRWKLYKGLL